jgi:hypothetical protein
VIQVVRLVLAITLIVSGVLAASAEEPSLQKGQSFYGARAALLHDGWKPVETSDRDIDGEILHSYGDAAPFFKHGFREVESCTGVDRDYCDFNYRKNGRCLLLSTEGEYIAPRSPTVANWWTYEQPAEETCSMLAVKKHFRRNVPGGNHRYP